ncbi:MAG: glycosyltransferase [Candidatus Hodarchaeota archaeon]
MSYVITICIVNYNSSDFILNTLYCLEKITKNNYKVIIRDNNSKLKDFLNLKNNIKRYSNVELYRVEEFSYKGSIAHGIAVNDLINKINTKYGVILDADCTFLYNNWDEILINEINEKQPLIGVPGSEELGSTRQSNFPILICVLFITEILKKLQIDFRPKEKGEKLIDTGHELAIKFIEAGYKGKTLERRSTRVYKSGPFRKFICAEFYLNGHRNIFGSHFGRGSTLGAAKYLKGWKKKIYLIPLIGSYLLKSKGKRERKGWIKVCKKLVNRK